MSQSIQSAELKKLLNASIEAKETAYAPYSNFRSVRNFITIVPMSTTWS